jgi:hypothetical protein
VVGPGVYVFSLLKRYVHVLEGKVVVFGVSPGRTHYTGSAPRGFEKAGVRKMGCCGSKSSAGADGEEYTNMR